MEPSANWLGNWAFNPEIPVQSRLALQNIKVV